MNGLDFILEHQLDKDASKYNTKEAKEAVISNAIRGLKWELYDAKKTIATLEEQLVETHKLIRNYQSIAGKL